MPKWDCVEADQVVSTFSSGKFSRTTQSPLWYRVWWDKKKLKNWPQILSRGLFEQKKPFGAFWRKNVNLPFRLSQIRWLEGRINQYFTTTLVLIVIESSYRKSDFPNSRPEKHLPWKFQVWCFQEKFVYLCRYTYEMRWRVCPWVTANFKEWGKMCDRRSKGKILTTNSN